MKKIATLLSIPVALLVAWGGASWYVGQQTESTLRQFIDQQNQQAAGRGVKQELVSYEKTAFGAKAISKLKFDMPPLNEALGDIQFVNEVQNGPIFLSGGLQFGSSRITTHLDMDALDKDKRQKLEAAFAGKPPLEGHTTIGFGGGATVDFSINPLKIDENGTTFTLDGATFGGNYNADMQGKLTAHVGKLEVKEATNNMTIPSMDVTGDMKGMVAGQVLGSFDLKAPKVSFLAEGTTVPVSFDMAMQSNSDIKDNEAFGTVNFSFDNIQGVKDVVNKINYKLEFAGLNVDGLKEISKLQADMQSALSQTNWNAEATDTPEGQKKQQELMDKVSKSGEQMVGVIFGKLLKADKSRLHNALAAESVKGKLNADIDLTYTGKAAVTMTDLISYGANDWAKLLKGKIVLDADKALLPEGTDAMLTPLSEQGLIKLEGNKVKSELELAGETATLNGKQMPFTELLQTLAPGMGGGMTALPSADGEGADISAADMGVPQDLADRIKKEGLTPEVMQALEESDDVTPETLQMFKQLQEMQQGAKDGEAAPDKKK